MRIFSLCPTHDASVCVLNDGKLEFFCKEERLSKIKHDRNPIQSIELYSKTHKGNIDFFVYSCPSDHEIQTRDFYREILVKKFSAQINENVVYSSVTHHLSHAMLAFVNSKFEEALVIVVDRDGSVITEPSTSMPMARESETVFRFNKKHGWLELQKSFSLFENFYRKHRIKNHLQKLYPNTRIHAYSPMSVVKVYEAATTMIGEHPLENGKTMGLSSYGEDIDYEPLFYNGIPLENKFTYIKDSILNKEIVCFFEDFDKKLSFENHVRNDLLTKENYQFYANKAKQVQLETQKQILDIITKYVNETGVKNVCLVGGYALNIVANNFYIKNLSDLNFYFEPTADDTGISIGAAMCRHYELTNQFAYPLEDNFYHYYDDTEILNVGTNSSIEEIVNLLINQKSVAIFEGNPEAGPRALGHRSILFDARNKEAKDIVNTIKKREWYRPFAGIILESEFKNYFEALGITNSPYMTINFDAKQNAKNLVPGIIHVDGTCRIQTVNNGFLYDLLKLFYDKTGCPMILNTSFNLAGEGLVQTKFDALQTLDNSNLDAVYFVDDNKLVLK